MTIAVIAMGSNISPRRKTLHAGVEALRGLEKDRLVARTFILQGPRVRTRRVRVASLAASASTAA